MPPNSQSSTLTAPLTYQTVVANGDFSQWKDGAPVGWTTRPGSLYEREGEMTYALPQSLRMIATPDAGATPTSLIYQVVRLQPNTRYELRATVAKSIHGTFAFRLRASAEGKVLPNQSPVLDETQYSAEMPWFPAVYRFTTGDHPEYQLAIQDYSGFGSPAWVSDVSITPLDPPAATQNAIGFDLFAHSPMRPFQEEGAPSPATRIAALHANATAGEFEPALLAIHALRDLEGVDLRLSASLSGPDGATLPADTVTIRSLAPQALLPISRPRSVAAGKNLGWWLTARIPDEAKPGLYSGTLTIESGGKAVATLPYRLNVAPYRLPAPDATFLAYHAEAYLPQGYLTKELRDAYYRDMAEHGMNSVTIYSTPDVDGKKIDFDRELRMSFVKGEAREKIKERYRWSEDDIEERAQWGLNQVMPLILKNGLASKEHPPMWLPLKIGGYTFGDMPGPALKASSAHWLSRKDWPEPLLYVIDEPAEIPERVEHARTALTRIKGLEVPLKTVTANVDVEELGHLYDVWIMGADRITEELTAKARTEEAELWAYACNIPADNSQFSRAMYGFWAYRTGIKGVAIWAYYDARIWYADQEGTVHGKNGNSNLSRVCVAPDGPIPTTSWEATREGINDYRHAMLFDQLIEEASQKAEKLEKEATSKLPAEAIAALDAALRPSKKPEDEAKAAAWKATTPEEESTAQRYLDGKALAAKVKTAKGWRRKLITSIPFDAMAPLKDTPSSVIGWVPALGAGDPYLSSEHKRNSIRGYIRFLSEALAKH